MYIPPRLAGRFYDDRGKFIAVLFDGLFKNVKPDIDRGVVGHKRPVDEVAAGGGAERPAAGSMREHRMHPVDRSQTLIAATVSP